MEASTEITDEAIVSRLAVGDAREFPVLVERYRRRVYAVLVRATGRRQDADDLFQETWLRVARKAASFDPNRRFASWVARVATNVAIDWMRAARTRAAVAGVADPAIEARAAAGAPSAVDELIAEAEWRRVAAALANLPERMREAVMLRYFEGLSEHGMSEQLGIPSGTVKSRLSNAMSALRQTLAEEAPDVDA